ncbi:MTQ2 [Candida oxycetoniae]|uniref:MTQ2 n=1 Tax=Candida oxycetoniae TaxID=497107 RepID=A0AAI9WYM9_9ASCO|nr:MTQ2 [Candida oxycetoniae]KAI3405213.2 MTQ2 [Candida oxycetoniae]
MFSTPIVKDVDYDKVYEPSEDSFCFLDCFEDQKEFLEERLGKKVTPLLVEIGTGSGIITTFLLQNILPDAVYMATDVNPSACTSVLNTVRLNCPQRACLVDSLRMSLVSGVRRNLVDVLVFNPPYVPATEVPKYSQKGDDDSNWLDLALLGGKDGMITTWQVLNDLEEILSSRGVAYILFCARNKPENVAEEMRSRGWRVDIVFKRKAGWEVLSILRFIKV